MPCNCKYNGISKENVTRNTRNAKFLKKISYTLYVSKIVELRVVCAGIQLNLW